MIQSYSQGSVGSESSEGELQGSAPPVFYNDDCEVASQSVRSYPTNLFS